MTKLEKLLGVLKKKVVFIQTHNYPDQDALAAAHGLKVLLEHNGNRRLSVIMAKLTNTIQSK